MMVQVALTEVYGNFGGLRYKNVPLEMWSQSKKKTHQQMKMPKKKTMVGKLKKCQQRSKNQQECETLRGKKIWFGVLFF